MTDTEMSRPQRDALPYRDNAGIMVFNRQGRVFVGRRVHDGSDDRTEVAAPWQMPQGGIDKGEDPRDAALRELYEETGIRTVRLIAEAPDWVHYDVPDEVLGIALKGKYRGQRQKWFAGLFEGSEDEIDVDHPGGGHHPAEFDAWRWEELERLPELIVPFKRAAYEKVIGMFATIPGDIKGGRT